MGILASRSPACLNLLSGRTSGRRFFIDTRGVSLSSGARSSVRFTITVPSARTTSRVPPVSPKAFWALSSPLVIFFAALTPLEIAPYPMYVVGSRAISNGSCTYHGRFASFNALRTSSWFVITLKGLIPTASLNAFSPSCSPGINSYAVRSAPPSRGLAIYFPGTSRAENTLSSQPDSSCGVIFNWSVSSLALSF